MKRAISRSWISMKEQFYILILLFIYRLLWGYFLYRFVRSAVIPVLLRYPDTHAGGSGLGRLLYYIEGQAALGADPGVQRWLWLLLGLSLLRLLLSPLSAPVCCMSCIRSAGGARTVLFPGDEALRAPGVYLQSS